MTLIEPEADPKRARILDGAMNVFCAYGYSRTTMDDIARAAEMSRPALYLLFRNKTDIYRAIGTALLGNSIGLVRAALQAEGKFADRMMQAIESGLISMMADIADSPHGAEILDMKNTLASDLTVEWRAVLGGHIADAIAAEARRTSVDLAQRGLSAPGLAAMLLDGLEGMKSRLSAPDAQREAARNLVRVVELAMRP
jgi:AcrR family transcriptional regulator